MVLLKTSQLKKEALFSFGRKHLNLDENCTSSSFPRSFIQDDGCKKLLRLRVDHILLHPMEKTEKTNPCNPTNSVPFVDPWSVRFNENVLESGDATG